MVKTGLKGSPMIQVIIALCLFVITGVNGAVAEEVTIAAASDLNFVFRELVTEYEKSTGDRTVHPCDDE